MQVRIVTCPLPGKSASLNPIEPHSRRGRWSVVGRPACWGWQTSRGGGVPIAGDP